MQRNVVRALPKGEGNSVLWWKNRKVSNLFCQWIVLICTDEARHLSLPLQSRSAEFECKRVNQLCLLWLCVWKKCQDRWERFESFDHVLVVPRAPKTQAQVTERAAMVMWWHGTHSWMQCLEQAGKTTKHVWNRHLLKNVWQTQCHSCCCSTWTVVAAQSAQCLLLLPLCTINLLLAKVASALGYIAW